MSQENLDVARAICAPWAHGDYGSAEWAHPDVEFVIADVATPARWAGRAGMASGLELGPSSADTAVLFEFGGGR